MNRWTMCLGWCAFLSTCVVNSLAFGQAKEAPPKEPEWTSLFDGKTLAGWKKTDFFKAGDVGVKDGAIVLQKGNRMSGVTYDSKKPFPKTNYEVSFEAKRVEGMDFFCTTTFPVKDSFCSFVVGGWGGKTVGLSSINGADASENSTNQSMEFKDNQWYRVRIRVTDTKIETWIDKEKLVDLETKGLKFSIRIECEESTPFGFSTWNTVGAIRDVKLRTVTGPDAPSKKE